MSALTAVVVAIPARNEQGLIGECLRSVGEAVAVLRRRRPGVPVIVTVALDTCTDATAEVAAAYPVLAVSVGDGCVGAARDAAVRAGLGHLFTGGHTPATTWIACTDADSRVPADWLLTQIEFAENAADLVVGTVEPVGDIDALRLRAWHERHQLVEGHRHVHGANIGIRARTWLQVGGFGDRAVHEDVLLVERARALDVAVVATDRTRVQTSARRVSRVADGFAAYLAAGREPVEAGPEIHVRHERRGRESDVAIV